MSSFLDSIARVALAHLPTPLEPLPRLSAELGGPEIWVKRDDCTGLATGGNKARKLEYLMGAAIAEGFDTVITLGGVQSNHARQTAAAAARLGLRCQLVLPRVVPRSGPEYEQSGNLLLDRLFGAEVFVVPDELEAIRQVQALQEAADADGRRAVVHPPGGSTPTGALGYVRAALELGEQLTGKGLSFSRVYLAVGTGGTLAGLIAGMSLASWSADITAVSVANGPGKDRGQVEALLAGLTESFDIRSAITDAIRFEDGFLGDGYGIPSQETLEALRLCATTEGLILDPVYTGKAMAALISDVRRGRAGSEPILFWHTGGSSGLFAYREEVARSLV